MEMIKVDPKLFVTCRLCLEDMGMYQITPVVQSQIKYCFDIDVNPFDSLPQLICCKCETILSDYVTIKRTYVGKQNALRARSEVQKGLEALPSSSVTQQGVVSSSQNELETPRSFFKAKKVNYSQKSSSESHSRSGSPPHKKKKLTKKIPRPDREPWEENYKRTFVCRQCDKHCSHIGTIRKHIKVHNKLYQKYKNIFNRFCTVPLAKVDSKPNHIDSQNVVLDNKKILSDKRNMTYHVIFTPKRENTIDNEVGETLLKAADNPDSSDDEILVKGNKSKRLRLISNSSNTSNDTVCLEVDVKVQPPEIYEHETDSIQQPECISIDSDTDNGSIVSDAEVDNNPDPKSLSINDYKTIKRIVTSCQNKYLKKEKQELEQNISTNSEFNINNKILNIGRKLITKPGANCKGLLRFVEQRNLELEWQPLPLEALSNKENVIRIMPKLRSKKLPDKIQWKFVEHDMEEDEHSENSDDLFESAEPLKIQNAVQLLKAKKRNKTKSQKSKPHSKAKTYTSSMEAPVVMSTGPILRVDDLLREAEQAGSLEANPDNSHAIVYSKEKSTNDDRILLNANPVANPKQMPKKACPKSAKPSNYDTVPSPPEQSDLGVGLHMPIITSTTSLAKDHKESELYEVPCAQAPVPPETRQPADASTSSSEVQLAVPSNNENQKTEASNRNSAVSDNSVPRIKVKPVSELMSQKALSNLNQRSPPFTVQSLPNGITMHQVAPGSVSILPPQTQFQRTSMMQEHNQENGDKKNGFVILDTVQFPNSKTNSPMKYVQNLLHTQNVILLDSKESIPTNFVSLIKFKVIFSPATISPTPVTLSLSLHAYKNIFYLGVRAVTSIEYVDINAMPAGWQWEILTMFATKPDIVDKLLHNTYKINREIHDCTKTLLRLIKSIRLIES